MQVNMWLREMRRIWNFIDMQIDAYGRPWLALSHNPNGDTGIFGTFTNGPTLYGELTALTVIPEGGPQTL